MTSHPGTPYPLTCAALEAAGIDSNTVTVDGVRASGYTVFVIGEDGKRQRDSSDNRCLTIEHPWPATIDRDVILDIYAKEARNDRD